jgi:ribosomal-protein-alanine N-acetyltransferase
MVNCTLRQPSPDDMKTLYKWKIEEPHHDWYSCRPVHPFGTFEEFYKKTLDRLIDPARMHRILVDNENNELLGEIKGFDLNERNHSMEFGYYLPESKRGKGYGKIMIQLFINEVFTESQMNLNKLYATTSGNNERSKQVLERTGFNLDGKNREHYWIGSKRYDQYVYSLLRNEWDEMNSKGNRNEEI